jgi:hypothetical protein
MAKRTKEILATVRQGPQTAGMSAAAQKMFAIEADAASKSAAATALATKGVGNHRMAIMQGTNAVQDAAVAFDMMGNTQQGWSMAMRGASNNIGALLATMGPWTAILGTTALIALPAVTSALWKMVAGSDAAGRSLESIGQRAIITSKRLEEMRESLRGVQEAQESLDKAIKPEAVQKFDTTMREARAEELREQFRINAPEVEEARRVQVEKEVETRTGREQEAVEIKKSVQTGAEQKALREVTTSKMWRWRHPAPPEGSTPEAISAFKASEKEEIARRRKILTEQLQSFKTPEEVDEALKADKLEFGKKESELIKKRIQVQNESFALDQKILATKREVIGDLQKQIERGEVPKGFPVDQQKIDITAGERVRLAEHAELVKGWRESRQRVDTARDQEAIDKLTEQSRQLKMQARPLEEESAGIARDLGFSDKERKALTKQGIPLPTIKKPERAKMELRSKAIGLQLEKIREQEQLIQTQEEAIRIRAHERERQRNRIQSLDESSSAPRLSVNAYDAPRQPVGQAYSGREFGSNPMGSTAQSLQQTLQRSQRPSQEPIGNQPAFNAERNAALMDVLLRSQERGRNLTPSEIGVPKQSNQMPDDEKKFWMQQNAELAKKLLDGSSFGIPINRNVQL